MKGVAWDGVGAPQLESAKKAGELISEVRTLRYYFKSQPSAFPAVSKCVRGLPSCRRSIDSCRTAWGSPRLPTLLISSTLR